jgi:hypothetical protein
MTMLIFFDTKCTSEGRYDAKLISIGFVTEDGKHTFYREIEDTFKPSDCDSSVFGSVVRKLVGGRACAPLPEVTLLTRYWIESLDCTSQLACAAPDFDWLWIERLFHEPGNWPTNLANSYCRLPLANPVFWELFEDFNCENPRPHNALDVAITVQKAWAAFTNLTLDGKIAAT